MCFGMRCRIQRADVIRPSQPSFCTPGRPPRNLSVTSLPSPTLRNLRPSISMRARAQHARALRRLSRPSFHTSSNVATVDFVNLAAVVREPRHFEPVAVRIDHAPPREIVDGRAPQHRLLAAGIHRDVAADARCVGRRRIDGEHEARALGRIGHAARDDAGFAENRRRRSPSTSGSVDHLDRARDVSSFSVLMTADSGVSGIAPPV